MRESSRPVTSVDGRTLRKERSREAMVDALLTLYEQGVLTPTVRQVAEVAGLTTRSIYHHFDDMESIADEVGRRQFERYRHLFQPPPVTGTLKDRVATLVRQRAELFEAIAPVRRAALVSMHTSATVAEQQRAAAALMRQQVGAAFADELAALAKPERRVLLDTLDLLTSWESWDRLRTWQRLSVEAATDLLQRLVHTSLRGRRQSVKS